MSIEIITIDEQHIPLLHGFDCGVQTMNHFLSIEAVNYHQIGDGATTLVIDTDSNTVLSYFTLKCSSLKLTDDNNLHHAIPAVEIARFAVNKQLQGSGFGAKVFGYIIDHINKGLRSTIGARIVTLFALPDAVGFYEKMDLHPLNSPDVEVFMDCTCKGCVLMYAPL